MKAADSMITHVNMENWACKHHMQTEIGFKPTTTTV